jgi:hypothetical protein
MNPQQILVFYICWGPPLPKHPPLRQFLLVLRQLKGCLPISFLQPIISTMSSAAALSTSLSELDYANHYTIHGED